MRKLRCILAIFAALALLAGCSGGPQNSGDNNPSENGTKFNEGAVDYVLEKNVTYTGSFPEERLGEVVSEGEEGARVLFKENFDDGDPRCGGDAVEYSLDSTSVHDGMLYVPAYDENDSGSHGWTTWAPKIEVFSDEYLATQVSFDCIITNDTDSNWSAPFFGFFKNSLTTIADNPSDGMYISLNKAGNAAFYLSDQDSWNWPAGNFSLKLDRELLEGKIHIDFIAIGRNELLFYIGGSLVADLKFNENEGKFEAFDKDGNVFGKGKYDSELLEGNCFQIFTHLGQCAIDNLMILGCTKGIEKVETTVKALPKDGHSLGLDITDRTDVISICYSVWHNAINGMGTGEIKNIADVTEMLKTYDFSAEKGFVNKETGETNNVLTKFHYWGKPAQGYYRSSDVSAIRNNMTMLYNAGVDFIILDLTFATSPGYAPGSSPWESYISSSITPLLDTIMLMRAEGKGTPYVVFWMGNDSMFEYMDEYFLGVSKWQDCFVYWDGKPFMMKWKFDESDSYEKWTVRGMYGLQGRARTNQWSYLEIDNSKTVSYDASGNPEHMCVDVATQETYMSVSTAHGRQGGKFFYSQWKNAFSVHPKIITVTWWNEWCAQLYYIDGVGYIFTDNFNEEYSRDIEPEDGRNGDTYYKWLCRYIADYRAGKKCPKLTNG